MFDTIIQHFTKNSQSSQPFLTASCIPTPLGPMIALTDEQQLYLLEFVNKQNLLQSINTFALKKQVTIIPGNTGPARMIQQELDLYFTGKLKIFTTPFHLTGTDFQKKAWRALLNIPYGQTTSYLQQATAIGNNKAFRAVARANATNQLAIIVPCHRIIRQNGALSGYAGGVDRKQWLINHEKQYV